MYLLHSTPQTPLQKKHYEYIMFQMQVTGSKVAKGSFFLAGQLHIFYVCAICKYRNILETNLSPHQASLWQYSGIVHQSSWTIATRSSWGVEAKHKASQIGNVVSYIFNFYTHVWLDQPYLDLSKQYRAPVYTYRL